MNDAPKRCPRTIWLSLGCLATVVVLIGIHEYLDGWNPDRHIGQHPKDDIERLVLKIAAWFAGSGSVAGVVVCALCLIKPSHFKGIWWAALLVVVNVVLCFFLILAERLKGFAEALPT